MSERLLAVVIAGMAIYLGYRLFFHVPYRRDDRGELELPGVKIVLSRVGPGVFFAALGSIVLYYSLTVQVSLGPDRSLLAVPTPGAGEVSEQQRTQARSTIAMLNCADRIVAAADGDGEVRDQISIAIREAKRTLMLSVWDEGSWGPADRLGPGGPSSNAPLEARLAFELNYQDCPK